MGALLATALLVAHPVPAQAAARPNPLAQAFWSRDLAGLRDLLEGEEPANASLPHRGLFSDLLAVALCRDPGPMQGDEDRLLREANRLEWARRPAALEKDLRDPDFFRRTDPTREAEEGPLLIWPNDGERWPDERLRHAPLPEACVLPTQVRPPPLPTAEWVEALSARAPVLASHWAWIRAGALHEAGDVEGARAAMAAVRHEQLEPPLRPWAEALSGFVDPAPPSVERILAAAPPLRPALALHGCVRALADGMPERAVALAEAAMPEGGDGALTLCRVAALAKAGRAEAAQAALVAGTSSHWDGSHRAWARALMLHTGSPDGLDAARVGLTGHEQREWLVDLGRAALELGRLKLAEEAEGRIRRTGDDLAADALAAENAFRTRDAARLETLLVSLLDEDGERFPRAHERRARDRWTLDLLRRLVLVDAANGGDRTGMLRDLEARLAFVAGAPARRELEVVRALLTGRTRDERPVRAVGTVLLARWPELPTPAPVKVHWPRPAGPLFAIPTGEGGLRSWFGGEESVDVH